MGRNCAKSVDLKQMTTLTPTISTIISVYNGEKYIEETFESIRHQTVLPDQVIIVNDGSTDGTHTKIDNFVKKHSGFEILVINQANKGLNAARLAGFRLSSKDLIHWLDADDVLHPDYYSVIRESFLEDSELGVAYTHHNFIDSEGSVISHPTARITRVKLSRFWIQNTKSTNTRLSPVAAYCWSDAIEPKCVFRRRVYEASFGWHPELGAPKALIGEGAVLMTEIALTAKIERIPEILYSYRIHPSQATNARNTHDYARKHLPKIYYSVPGLQSSQNKRLIRICELAWKYRVPMIKKIDSLKHNLRYHPAAALRDILGIMTAYVYSSPILLASSADLQKVNATAVVEK